MRYNGFYIRPSVSLSAHTSVLPARSPIRRRPTTFRPPSDRPSVRPPARLYVQPLPTAPFNRPASLAPSNRPRARLTTSAVGRTGRQNLLIATPGAASCHPLPFSPAAAILRVNRRRSLGEISTNLSSAHQSLPSCSSERKGASNARHRARHQRGHPSIIAQCVQRIRYQNRRTSVLLCYMVK